MEFLIISPELDILAPLDTFKSAIWTRRYWTSGDFEIYTPATPAMIDLLQEGRIIARADDTTQAGIIESLRMTSSQEEGRYIVATGRMLQSILSRRIVWKQTTFTGSPEKVVRRLVTESAIAPEIEKRIISGLELDEPQGLEGSMRIQFTGDNVQEAIEAICQENRLGYDIKLDLTGKRFLFGLYKGADRTYNQSERPFVVFSADFDNLASSEYAEDTTEQKNVAQVAGEGEGAQRRKITVTNTNQGGLGRKELFVDAKGITSNDESLAVLSYDALLAQKGAEALAEVRITQALDAEIITNYSSFQLGRDFFLGDLVEIVDEYGHEMTPRITEIIESQDDTGHTCIPTLAVDED